LLVQLGAPHRRPRAGELTCISVGEAFALGLLQGDLLNENTLALVAASRAAEADDDRIKATNPPNWTGKGPTKYG